MLGSSGGDVAGEKAVCSNQRWRPIVKSADPETTPTALVLNAQVLGIAQGTRFNPRSPVAVLAVIAMLPLLLVLGLPKQAAAVTIDLPVRLRETAGVTRLGELATAGIPIDYQTGLLSTTGLGILNPSGQPVPAQFKVTSRWGGDPSDASKPIRWLLADFIASTPASSTAQYRLVSGQGSGSGSIAVTQTAGSVTVDTGAAKFSISKSAYRFLDSVVVGGREFLDLGDPSNGIVFKATDGTLFRSGSTGTLLATQVTESGPAKVVVRQDWQFEDLKFADDRAGNWSDVYTAGVSWLYDPSEAHRYRIGVTSWTTFVRDSGAVRSRVRVQNPNTCMIRFTGGAECGAHSSLNSVMFDDASVHLGLDAGAGFRTGDGQTGSLSSDLTINQESSGRDGWDYYKNLSPGQTWKRYARDVTFRGYRTSLGSTQLAEGDVTAGYLSVGPDQDGVFVSAGIAGAWKQFPVAVRAASGGEALELGLFPGEFAREHTLRAAEMKTHEIALNFGSDPTGLSARRAQLWVESPLRVEIDPDDMATTGAMPGFEKTGDESEYDLWNLVSIDRGVSQAHNNQGWWNPSSMIANLDQYGHWGKDMTGYLVNDNEQRTSTDLSKYNQYRGFLRQSLRLAITDEVHADVWWRAGVDANRAQADSGYLVQPYAVQDSLWTGINFAHCFHEYPLETDYPRGQGFGCDFSGDTGGLWELYALTGYEPALDAFNSHLNNIYTRAHPSEINYDIHDYGGPFRRFGSYIETLMSGWEAIGDRKFLDRAVVLAKEMGVSGNTYYLDCPCPSDPSESYYINTLFAGWLTRSLGRIADALVGLGESGTADYSHVKSQLNSHAQWLASKVIFQESHGLWVLPYYWYTNDPIGNGNDPNTSPLYSSYALMVSDGLAYSHRHGGGSAHLDAADRLFRSTVIYPFTYGWQQFTYTTINDAGKFAEFGGVFISETHRSEAQPVTISGTATSGGSGYVSVYSAQSGELVAYGPMIDGFWSFVVPAAACPDAYKVLISAPAGYQSLWSGNQANFTLASCVSAPSSNNDQVLPSSGTIAGYVKTAAATDLPDAVIYAWRADNGQFAGWAVTASDGRYEMQLNPGSQYKLLAHTPGLYEDKWHDGASGYGDATPTTASGTANFTVRGAGLITGTATRSGQPLASTYVSAYSECGCEYAQNAVTDSNGDYAIKVPSTAASGATYRVRFIPSSGPLLWYGGSSWFWAGTLVNSPSSGVSQEIPA